MPEFLGVAVRQIQFRGKHDLAACPEHRGAVPESAFPAGPFAHGAVEVHGPHRDRAIAEFLPVGARVDGHGAAHRAGYPREALDSGQAPADRLRHKISESRAGERRRPFFGPVHPRETVGDRDHGSGPPLVGNHQVRTAAHGEQLQTLGPDPEKRVRQLLFVGGLQQVPDAPSQLEGGAARHGGPFAAGTGRSPGCLHERRPARKYSIWRVEERTACQRAPSTSSFLRSEVA